MENWRKRAVQAIDRAWQDHERLQQLGDQLYAIWDGEDVWCVLGDKVLNFTCRDENPDSVVHATWSALAELDLLHKHHGIDDVKHLQWHHILGLYDEEGWETEGEMLRGLLERYGSIPAIVEVWDRGEIDLYAGEEDDDGS